MQEHATDDHRLFGSIKVELNQRLRLAMEPGLSHGFVNGRTLKEPAVGG